METIDRVKLRLGIKDTSKDDILALIIEDATNYILNVTNRIDLVPQMNSLVEKLAVEYYIQTINMNNNIEEGLTNVKSESHSEGGISDSVTYFDLQNSGNLYVPNSLNNEILHFKRNKMCLLLEKEGAL